MLERERKRRGRYVDEQRDKMGGVKGGKMMVAVCDEVGNVWGEVEGSPLPMDTTPI